MTPMLRMGRLLPALACVIALGVAGIAGMALERVAKARALQEARTDVFNRAAALRTRIEGEMNATIFAVKGLTNFVGANPQIGSAEFEPVARRMLGPDSHIINITLAPDNVIRYVHPLEGNEQAIGLEILRHEDQGPSLQRMIDTGRTVVTGPVELVQGGLAIIVRTPVYRDDGSYWGAASVPVDHRSLLDAAGLTGPVVGPLAVALRGRHGLGAQGEHFFGDAAVYGADPVQLSVTFEGQSWLMAVAPAEGWEGYAALPLWWRAIGLSVILAIGLVAAVLTGQAQRLRRVSRRLEAMVAAIPDSGFVINADGQLLESFGGRERRLYHDGAALKNRNLREIMDPETAELASQGIRRAIKEQRLVTLEYPLHAEAIALLDDPGGPEGTQWFQARIYPLPPGVEQNPAVLWLAYNITEQRQAEEVARINEEQIRYLAMHDHLTGLANRAYFLEHLNKALNMGARGGHKVGLLFIDLDFFKAINDGHGHDTGDLVLQEIAGRLQALVRQSDTVARHGGDEFVILMPEVNGVTGAIAVAEKVIAALSEPVCVNREVFRVGASVGIGLYPDHGRTADDLQRAADDAMYAAKAAGRDSYRVARNISTT